MMANSSSDLTNKQQAVDESGKSRQTLNQWAKQTSVSKEAIEDYEIECNALGKEFTSKAALKYGKPSRVRRAKNKQKLKDEIYIQLQKLKKTMMEKYYFIADDGTIKEGQAEIEDLKKARAYFSRLREDITEIISEIEQKLEQKKHRGE